MLRSRFHTMAVASALDMTCRHSAEGKERGKKGEGRCGEGGWGRAAHPYARPYRPQPVRPDDEKLVVVSQLVVGQLWLRDDPTQTRHPVPQ